MKRRILVALAVPMAVTTGMAGAQQAPQSVDAIACQLGGTCPAAAPSAAAVEDDDGSVVVGEERPFSMFKKPAGIAAASAQPHPQVVAARVAPPSVGRRAPVALDGTRRFSRAVAAVPVARIRPVGKADMALTFANGSADLDSAGRESVAMFARALTQPDRGLTGARFHINGHTNAVGARLPNLDLSRRRAEAVVAYMVSLGVPRDRLEAQGLGPDMPLAGTAPKDAANRRVEIVRD